MALRKEGRKAVLSINQRRSARLNKEKTMNNLFTKEKSTKGRNKFLLIIGLLVLLCGFLFWLAMEQWYPRYSNTAKTKAPSQPVVETNIPVPPKPIVAATPPRQEAAHAVPPCPEKKRTHLKKKKIQRPKPAPPVTSETFVASGIKGCVEIHFTTKPGDMVVKFPVFGPAGSDIAKDSCTAVKRASDSTFGPWRNGFCSTALPILCDFSQHERIIGQKIRLMGSYRIEKQGEHILRLPGYIAEKQSGYVTALVLVRGKAEQPKYPTEQPGDTKAFVAAYKYGEQRQEWIANNSDAIGVRWFDYTNGIAKVYYSKAEVPKDTAQLYWPWKEWRGP